MANPTPALETDNGRIGRFGRPLNKESLSQRAYLVIRDSLMRSRLKPGQMLIAREVANDLGISVTPVRESLLRLVSEHGLVMDDRGTVMVPTLNRDRCIEIRDLRVLNEGEGAARAARLVTDAEIHELALIHDRYLQAEHDGDFTTALVANESFHFMLCRLARSPVLFRIVENLWVQFGPVLGYIYQGRSRPFRDRKHGHILVIESLRERAPEKARQAIGQDILVGGMAILDVVRD
jgi:GntR family transcriptional regulator, colanic acid and biofilm gene transcriptional regulator